eukprot:12934158-Prorocentrum_lima.AAC.1
MQKAAAPAQASSLCPLEGQAKKVVSPIGEELPPAPEAEPQQEAESVDNPHQLETEAGVKAKPAP